VKQVCKEAGMEGAGSR